MKKYIGLENKAVNNPLKYQTVTFGKQKLKLLLYAEEMNDLAISQKKDIYILN